MARRKFEQPPLTFGRDTTAWIRKIAQAVCTIMQGGTNNLRDVTLTAGATSTTLTDLAITPNTIAVWSPKTATAAAAMTALRWSAGVGVGTFTHNNTADTDRHFGVILHG